MANVSKTVTLTAVGSSGWIPIDLAGFHAGLGLIATFKANGVQGASCLYNVEVTGDKLTGPITHVNLHDTLNNKSSSANSSLAFPCTAIRITATQLTAGADLTLAVVPTGG